MDVISLEALVKALRVGQVEVTFTKLNGDVRVMTCTTDLSVVPPSAWPKGQEEVQESEQHRRNIRVFDVNAQAWRSFVFDRVSAVKVL